MTWAAGAGLPIDKRRGYPHQTTAFVIMKVMKRLPQFYLQAVRCSNSERSWCYSRRCRYSWRLRGTEKSRFDCVWCLYKVAGFCHSTPQSLVSPESSWQPLCRLLASLDAPDRWRPPRTASPRSTPTCLSSWGRGRCWWLSAERGGRRSRLWAGLTVVCAVLLTALSPYFTIICLEGMKSALCRTRSKILASWGLMKASSERRDGEQSESSGSVWPNLL